MIIGSGVIGAKPKFPEVLGAAVSNSGATTSHVVALPAGIAAGDLLIVLFVSRFQIGATPSGWTMLFSDGLSTSSQTRMVGFWKIAAGSEGSSAVVPTAAGVASAHNSYRIKGRTPVAAVSSGGAAVASPPTLAAPWGSTRNLWLSAAGFSNAGTPSIVGVPAGYTNFVAGTETSVRTVCGSARREREAGVETPGAFTISGSGVPVWVAATIAIRPR